VLCCAVPVCVGRPFVCVLANWVRLMKALSCDDYRARSPPFLQGESEIGLVE